MLTKLIYTLICLAVYIIWLFMLLGITPESKSFKGDGFGPPPAKWKGTCGHFANFSGCNK